MCWWWQCTCVTLCCVLVLFLCCFDPGLAQFELVRPEKGTHTQDGWPVLKFAIEID